MANKSGTRLRGYGAHHKRLRKIWDIKVQAGEVNCARCGRWIKPGTPWDLDHADNDRSRSTYLGPSHAKCNRGWPHRRRPVPQLEGLVMARRSDSPCSRCGQLLWSSKRALPAGQGTCRKCRRLNPRTYGLRFSKRTPKPERKQQAMTNNKQDTRQLTETHKGAVVRACIHCANV